MWILWLVLFFALGSIAYACLRGAPWVPTRHRDVERFLRVAKLTPHDVLFELGCGDGRMVTHAAKVTLCRGVGVELAWPLALVAFIRARLAGVNVRIRVADAQKVDLSGATVVYLFLMPKLYEALRPRLEAELMPGTRVISYVWPIKGWTPTQIDKPEGREALYIYTR